MKATLESQSGYKPIIRLQAENDDDEHALGLIWEQGVRIVSYNGSEKVTLTCGQDGEEILAEIDQAVESFETGDWTFPQLTKAILRSLRHIIRSKK